MTVNFCYEWEDLATNHWLTVCLMIKLQTSVCTVNISYVCYVFVILTSSYFLCLSFHQVCVCARIHRENICSVWGFMSKFHWNPTIINIQSLCSLVCEAMKPMNKVVFYFLMPCVKDKTLFWFLQSDFQSKPAQIIFSWIVCCLFSWNNMVSRKVVHKKMLIF